MKYFFSLAFLLFCFNQISQAQCNDIFCTENGYDLPPLGSVGIIIIFAEWEDTCNSVSHPNWLAGQLPSGIDHYQDSNRDQPPASTTKIGQYFWDASLGGLRVYTDYYNQVVTVPCGSNRNDVLAAIEAQALAGNPNFLTTSEGRLPSYFDTTEDETFHGLPKGNNSNDIIDAIAIIWRNNTAVADGDCAGFAFTDAPTTTLSFLDANGNLTQRGVGVLGNWRDSGGTCPGIQVEYMHTLFGGNNWHTGSGAARHALPFPHGSYGMNTQGNSAAYTACGWDRFMLGWRSPYHEYNPPFDDRYSIAALDGNENLVETDLSIPNAQEQIFILRDFYTTGDMIRIKLPFFNHMNNNVPKNQYLWLENRQRIAIADRSNYEQYSCKSPWVKGIYSYIQIGKDQKNADPGGGGLSQLYNQNNVPANANSLASWLYPLSAEGKFDFIYREDLKSESSPNPGCIPTKRTLPIDRAASAAFPNPFTGNSDLDPKRYDLDNTGNKDGRLEAGVDNYSLGFSEVIDETVVFNLHRFGDSDDAFTLNGNNKIGIGTNPSNTSVYTLRSGAKMDMNQDPDQPDEPYENRIIWLNGISIEIIEETLNTEITDVDGNPSMDLKVRVRWDDYLVDQHQRWCGDIILRDDPNDTWQSQVVIGENIQVILDQGTSPTKYFGEDQGNGTYLFADPTVMTIESGTKLHMLEETNLLVRNGSTLIIEDGAEVLMENGASIVIEEGAFLELRGNNIHLNGEETFISIRGTLITADDVDFTFTGDGYADFYENHVLEMGQNSNFVLGRAPEDEGTRFLLLHENTTLSVSNRLLELRDGVVEYRGDSKIQSVNAEVIFDKTEFILESATTKLPTAFVGKTLTSCFMNYCKFEGFDKAILLLGNMTNMPIIRTNQFSFCNTAVEVGNTLEVSITDNYFLGNEFHSIKLEKIAIAYLGENAIIHSQPYTGIGCELKEVNFAYFKSTGIQYCETGILTEKSNVFINYGAAITDCDVGVYYANNPTAEYLLSVGRCQCGNIYNNNVGVQGANIVLDIDVFNHQAECNYPSPPPNRFDGNGIIFDICYTDPTFSVNSTIMMRGNYWGGASISNYDYNLRNGAFNGYCVGNQNMSVDDSDFFSGVFPPPPCSFIEAPYPQTPQYPATVIDKVRCEFTESGQIVEVHEQSRSAYEALFNEDYLDAKSKYTPVANLDRLNNTNPRCVNKINIARCMVEAIDNGQFASPYASWLGSAMRPDPFSDGVIAIYPNPASHSIIIESQQEGAYQTRIYNIFGQSVGAFEFTRMKTFDIEHLQGGVYFLEIIDVDGNLIQAKKLVVE